MLAPIQEAAKEAIAPQKKRGASVALGVALFALAVAFAYSFAVDRLHLKAELAESNFQANLLRLGEFLHGTNHPEVVVVGSSMGARLLPSFFQHRASNISLDGSSGRTGLKFIVESKRPVRVLLVEENTITRPSDNNDALLFEAVQQPQMQASAWFSFLRAAYRPSSIVYSLLKKETDKSRGAPASAEPNLSATAPHNIPTPPNESETRDLRQAVEMIRSLHEKGTQVLIYRLPMGRSQSPLSALRQALPEAAFVDVESELAVMGHVPRYSDGLHLVVPSRPSRRQSSGSGHCKKRPSL